MKMLTTKQALQALQERGISVSYPTVAQWTREGRFTGAQRKETERGPVWLIPRDSVLKFEPPVMGRPPGSSSKAGGAEKPATGQRRISNARRNDHPGPSPDGKVDVKPAGKKRGGKK